MIVDTPLRLAVFDLDGTLLDSRAGILAGFAAAADAIDVPAPESAALLGAVGLPIGRIVEQLYPQFGGADVMAFVQSYRQAWAVRTRTGADALFPGVKDMLARLDRAGVLLGIATGKSRRGLDHALQYHGLDDRFLTVQTADIGPGKPHPDMMMRALAETGTMAENAAMVGDSVHDVQMAVAAGVPCVGVTWGFTPVHALRAAGASAISDDLSKLDEILDGLWHTGGGV